MLASVQIYSRKNAESAIVLHVRGARAILEGASPNSLMFSLLRKIWGQSPDAFIGNYYCQMSSSVIKSQHPVLGVLQLLRLEEHYMYILRIIFMYRELSEVVVILNQAMFTTYTQ